MIFPEYDVMVALGLSYLGLHFLLYVLVLRDRSLFQTERGIFLYHFGSATLFTLVVFAATLSQVTDGVLAIATGLSAIHCIYSLSFLELWTLAEGSYSMSILTGIASQGTLSRNALIDGFARIGDAKKGNRLSVLTNLSLAHRDRNHWRLTARGGLLANALNVLLWLTAIKKRG